MDEAIEERDKTIAIEETEIAITFHKMRFLRFKILNKIFKNKFSNFFEQFSKYLLRNRQQKH